MGSYTFSWAHAAEEVFVTGDFDNWGKTIKLEKEDGVFKKTVELPKAKHQYKFVVDGNWLTNDSHAKEDDGKGIYNNVLYPDEITEHVSTTSSAAPESTTAALAGAVPKEANKSSDSIPGAFPLTPPAATPGSEPQAFSINPFPASEGLGNPVKLAPGEKGPDPSTFTSNTVESTVKHDKEPEVEEEEKVSVAPIPATAGAGNPIHLAPGEKVPDPSTLTSNTVSSTAKTDASSYEKSDAPPPQLGPVDVTPEAAPESKGGMFGLPAVLSNLIPESSLPMGLSTKTEKDPGVTVQSAAPISTTASLAGQVPKEPKAVPEAVTDSQKEASVAPEASANPEAVQDKKEVEQELKEKVPEEPPTAEGTASSESEKYGAAAVAGASAVAGAVTAAAYTAKDKAVEAYESNGSAANGHTTTSNVPDLVAESQKQAHVDPEATANPDAVVEKKEVEAELLKAIPAANETGESAPNVIVPEVVAESQQEAHASPEASANREAVEEKKQVEAELLQSIPKVNETGDVAPAHPAATVPEVVVASQEAAHVQPEASANTEAVEEKKGVEAELLKQVGRTDEAGEPAPAITAATSLTAPGDAPIESKPTASATESDGLNASASKPAIPESSLAQPAVDSRDVSPMSKQPTQPATTQQTAPTVATGVGETTTTEAKSTPETPKKDVPSSSKDTPASVASATTDKSDKKKKRSSIFGKLKAKFSSKD